MLVETGREQGLWLLFNTVGYLTQDSGASLRARADIYLIQKICLCELHSS